MINENKTVVTITNEIGNSNVLEFNPSELPQIISNQVHKMTELDIKIKKVMKDAENAKKAANAANKKITFFNGRKEAIEELQSSGKSLASAIQTNAEALQLSFEFQKELADISKFLIRLGVSNIVQNRIVVRQLELKLKGASQEEISELAREELLSVVRQLKAQEDLLHKQEQHNKKIKELTKQIDVVSENNDNLAENVISIEETDKRQDVVLEKLIETDKRHEEKLVKLFETDKRHDSELSKQIETDKRHDKKLAELEQVDKQHNEELAKQIETDNRHDEKLFELEDKNKQHKEELVKQFEIDKRHDEKLSELGNLNKQHDEKLTNQIEIDKRHDEELDKQKKIDKQHDLKILQLEEKTVKYEKEFEEIKIINENQFVEINKLKEILKQNEQSISLLTNQKKRLNSKLNIVVLIFSVLTLLLSLLIYFMH